MANIINSRYIVRELKENPEISPVNKQVMDPNAGKKKLINRLSREDAIKGLQTEGFTRTTTSFYRYVDISDPVALRNELYEEWADLGVFGQKWRFFYRYRRISRKQYSKSPRIMERCQF